MTIQAHIQAFALDAYKDRTGDYRATKLPTVDDFTRGKFWRRSNQPFTARKHLTRLEWRILEEKQNGRCAICGSLPNGRALSVDHDHATGKVRALICHTCNIAIGMIQDDPATARAIADYLEIHLVCQ